MDGFLIATFVIGNFLPYMPTPTSYRTSEEGIVIPPLYVFEKMQKDLEKYFQQK